MELAEWIFFYAMLLVWDNLYTGLYCLNPISLWLVKEKIKLNGYLL